MSDAHEADCHGFEDERGELEGICSDWCYGCMRCEPLREGDHRVCAECWHVFRTPEDLIEATRRLVGMRPLIAITCCPICAHDF